MRKTLVAVTALACASITAEAAQIVNGGFESGLTGWTRVVQAGGAGDFLLQNGALSPLSLTAVPAPPGGSNAAMTDSEEPGSHVLYQVFTPTVPVPLAILSFDLYVGNRAAAFVTPNTLDFANAQNQQARVDILVGGADPFSMNAGDILQNLFRTDVGEPNVSGYATYSFNVTSLLNANLNQPLMLRFAEVDNVNLFQFGVDNVTLSVIPEPSTWLLSAAGLAGLAAVRRRFVRS